MHFSTLKDPRIARTRRHKLIDIMVIAICSQLCGANSFTEMEQFGKAKKEWFKTFLELPDGIPSHDTFNRLFAAMDPKSFLECFQTWTQSLRQTVAQEVVAIDGKALRRALNQNKSIPYVVSAWADGNRLVLGQLKVDDKSNEITAIPALLHTLDVKGCVVTLDAMGCQKTIAKEIQDAGANYVLALKGNHETIHTEVQLHLQEVLEKHEKSQGRETKEHLQTISTSDTRHGRKEDRTYYQTNDISWFSDRDKWEGIQSVGMVESMREKDGIKTFETRYFLSSLPLDVETFAKAVRGHWGVENKVHWSMDVTFGEDQSRARTGYAAENLASLRRLALNMLKNENSKKLSIRTKMLVGGWDHAYLMRLLGI